MHLSHVLLLTLTLGFFSGVHFAVANDCVNFSGDYQFQYSGGDVLLTIRQTGCAGLTASYVSRADGDAQPPVALRPMIFDSVSRPIPGKGYHWESYRLEDGSIVVKHEKRIWGSQFLSQSKISLNAVGDLVEETWALDQRGNPTGPSSDFTFKRL